MYTGKYRNDVRTIIEGKWTHNYTATASVCAYLKIVNMYVYKKYNNNFNVLIVFTLRGLSHATKKKVVFTAEKMCAVVAAQHTITPTYTLYE